MLAHIQNWNLLQAIAAGMKLWGFRTTNPSESEFNRMEPVRHMDPLHTTSGFFEQQQKILSEMGAVVTDCMVRFCVVLQF